MPDAPANDAPFRLLSRVDLAVTGSLLRELPHLVDRPFTAFVARQEDWIVATALGDPSA